MDVLPRPPDREDKTGPQFWIDEAIWGHRLHDEQTPWFTLLEFLGAAWRLTEPVCQLNDGPCPAGWLKCEAKLAA